MYGATTSEMDLKHPNRLPLKDRNFLSNGNVYGTLIYEREKAKLPC